MFLVRVHHGTDLWQLNYKRGKEWPSKTLQSPDSRRLSSCNEIVFAWSNGTTVHTFRVLGFMVTFRVVCVPSF